MTFSWASSW